MVVLSVVSHNDADKIINNFSGIKLPSGWNLIVRDNTGERELEVFCVNNGFIYTLNLRKRGFGENHNLTFENYGIQSAYFLVLNPDIKLNIYEIKAWLDSSKSKNYAVVGARVIEKDGGGSHNRKFPTQLDIIVSWATGRKRYLLSRDKSNVTDWVGGSFMLIDSKIYKSLNGFDEAYFMYFEDVDFCRRTKELGGLVYHTKEISFYHEAQRDGNLLFSRRFLIKLSSFIKYFYG